MLIRFEIGLNFKLALVIMSSYMHCSVEQVVKLAPIMRHLADGEGPIRRCNKLP